MVLTFWTSLAWAEQQAGVKPEQVTSSDASDALLPMLLALLFIVFIIYGIAWLAKRFNLTPNNTGHFKLISSMSLGGRERILIIEVQGQQHVIGVTPQNVNHLFKLEHNIENKAGSLTEGVLLNKLNSLFGYQAAESQSKDKN